MLQRKCQRDDGVFDEKLADYVFFPLSQILRRKQKYTDTLSELAIKSVGILLKYGWRKVIALDLAKQLLILLTFVAGGVPGQTTGPVPEEQLIEAYGALGALFKDLSVSPGGPASLVDTGTIPALGHCVTVILDGIKDGTSAHVQIAALQALATVWTCVKDQEALSSFLPGTISALTKCLMPSTANRRSRKTIVIALELLEQVMISILSDIRTRNIRDSGEPSTAVSISSTEQKTLTKPWLKATSGQIKLAISNVIRLRNHESMEVRNALNKVCITILDECHDTLAESSSMLVETCMTLIETKADDDLTSTTTLMDLATIHPELGETIKVTVYNWITSLPRIMESNDETAKHVALGQLAKAQQLVEDLNLDSSVLQDALGASLRDSVTATLDPSPTEKFQEVDFDLNSQDALTLTTENGSTTRFAPVVMPQESQRTTRRDLENLLDSFGSRQSQISMAGEMLDYVRGSSGTGLLSAYWLSYRLLRYATLKNEDLDEFFTSALTVSDDQKIVQQELFSYSLSVLSNADEADADWRIQAIALEAIAATAQRLKKDFRSDLVDVLYPVAQLLGSPNPRLRQHAITCLNIVSRECGYDTASELIIDNVDYMVNAISLRLNTFDISPQAPQVLVMMIRLTGPSLLLYLDDVVESIFAALDNFHGYQRLVEILFSVLGEIVDVGSKSGQLQLTSGDTTISHRKAAPSYPTIDDIRKALRKKQPRNNDLPHAAFPTTPWKSATTLLDEADASTEDPSEDQQQQQPEEPPSEIAPLPPTKTYTLLHRIAHLTQHYLTTSSPHLRTRLLTLLTTSFSSLASNENQFLPLINDIWPVVIARLYDSEPYVAIAAAETVSAMCRCAGDFLGTRIRTEWGDLMKFTRQAKGRMAGEKKGSGGRGPYSQVSKVWESVVGLLGAIVENVMVEDEMFDEVLEVLGMEEVERRENLRAALEVVNADAVWLGMQSKGRHGRVAVPVVEGYTFAALD